MTSKPVYTVLDLINYKLFETRVGTFTNSWKNKYFTPYQMASVGFEFVDEDEVKCVYCFKTLKNLTKEDNLELKHRDMSPTCKFDQKPFGKYYLIHQ